MPGWAQKDNRFEVSKNLDNFNSLLKEVEMFYVDSVDVDKTVQRGNRGQMLAGLDPYTEYYPERKNGGIESDDDRRIRRYRFLDPSA